MTHPTQILSNLVKGKLVLSSWKDMATRKRMMPFAGDLNAKVLSSVERVFQVTWNSFDFNFEKVDSPSYN